MESTGIPSRVQISYNVVDSIAEGEFEFEPRGKIHCKGKGLVEAFMLQKRLQPKDKYHMGPASVASPNNKLLNSPFSKRSSIAGGGRRPSTLQGTLVALQASLAEFRSCGSVGRSAMTGGRSAMSEISEEMSVFESSEKEKEQY